MLSSTIGLAGSVKVLPVVVCLRPTIAAISPAPTSVTSSRLLPCIRTIRPTRSFSPLELFKIYDPATTLPE